MIPNEHAQHPHHFSRSFLLVFTLFITFNTTLSNAAFNASDLRGPFIRRYGLVDCPDSLYFQQQSTTTSADPFNLSVTSLHANDQQCTTGSLSATLSPRTAPPGGELALYMTSTRGVGQVVGVDVIDPITCPNASLFEDRAYFTLAKTDENVTIDWRNVFFRNDTVLQTSMASPNYIFQKDIAHVVINSICLYTTITVEEFNDQRGEACFPSNSKISLSHGKQKTMYDLSIGDDVLQTYSSNRNVGKVIAWTHRDYNRVYRFLQIRTKNGNSLTVSHGHFVYADDTLMPARLIKIGMVMRMAFPDGDGDGNGNVVEYVKTVWRIGLFNPQTSHGDIVVDGFVCSTYTEAVAVNTAHALLSPVRFLFSMIQLFFRPFSHSAQS